VVLHATKCTIRWRGAATTPPAFGGNGGLPRHTTITTQRWREIGGVAILRQQWRNRTAPPMGFISLIKWSRIHVYSFISSRYVRTLSQRAIGRRYVPSYSSRSRLSLYLCQRVAPADDASSHVSGRFLRILPVFVFVGVVLGQSLLMRVGRLHHCESSRSFRFAKHFCFSYFCLFSYFVFANTHKIHKNCSKSLHLVQTKNIVVINDEVTSFKQYSEESVM
jgi:hypothetical protein